MSVSLLITMQKEVWVMIAISYKIQSTTQIVPDASIQKITATLYKKGD
jgi:hypothetical protein